MLDPDPYQINTDPKPCLQEQISESSPSQVRAVEKWNKLPDWVRVEEKPDSFKRQLKKAMA
jgi:hypothetical protein